MPILDCENLDTLRSSLESVTGIRASEYESFLSSFDIYDFYQKHPELMYPQNVFLFLLRNEFKANINHQRTCWFHITRSKRNHHYSKGILPLNAIIDEIWEQLFCLVSDKIQKNEWVSFRHSVQTNFVHHNACLYRDKIKESFHWGPCGFLAKDLDCFDQEFSAWHYFDGPEIVVDICRCASTFFKIDILKLYQESTLPCVVKFEYQDHHIEHVGYALLYLYAITHREKISRSDNICFSTRGKLISPTCIKGLQFYDGH